MAGHDTDNYTIGKGIVTFKEKGSGVWRDVGNVTAMSFTPSTETLDHFTSREGIKKKDKSITLSVEGTIGMTLDEWSVENLNMVLMGVQDTDSSGRKRISVLQRSAVEGELKFTGTNAVGPQYEWHVPNVSFKPNAAIDLISDEWGEFEVEGQALADTNGDILIITQISDGDTDSGSSS